MKPASLLSIAHRYESVLALWACGVLVATDVAAGDEAHIVFAEAVAVYGPGLYPAMTKIARCGDYRVFVAYGNGTDMLFMDKLVPVQNDSTFAAEDGMSFAEFNSYEESLQIEDVSCRLRESNHVQISGLAHSFHTDKDFRFTVVIDVAKHSYTYDDTQK